MLEGKAQRVRLTVFLNPLVINVLVHVVGYVVECKFNDLWHSC